MFRSFLYVERKHDSLCEARAAVVGYDRQHPFGADKSFTGSQNANPCRETTRHLIGSDAKIFVRFVVFLCGNM